MIHIYIYIYIYIYVVLVGRSERRDCCNKSGSTREVKVFFFFFLKCACILIKKEIKVSQPIQCPKYMTDRSPSRFCLNSD
jgi:hypothetical protein